MKKDLVSPLRWPPPTWRIRRRRRCCPQVGLQPVPGDDLLPRAELQLEDLWPLLQHQVGARIVVRQWQPLTTALHVDMSSSIQGGGWQRPQRKSAWLPG